MSAIVLGLIAAAAPLTAMVLSLRAGDRRAALDRAEKHAPSPADVAVELAVAFDRDPESVVELLESIALRQQCITGSARVGVVAADQVLVRDREVVELLELAVPEYVAARREVSAA